MNPIAEDILMHYGVKRRSGRYPWGSGENPYQHGGDFLARVEELEAMGKSQKEIAEELKMSTTDLRMQVRVAKHSGTTVTLPAENWSGRAQTVKDNILLADEKYWYIVCADADCFMAVSETGVKADNITVNGQVTFHCEVTPTENLTIYILRLEVEQNNE